ncbi:GABA permease [Desulfosporosinus acididurans]|uniref:GABA permease n=1 Tax=Desulfosporosinus acididurans TaxID=476652 RepID=A0A0J1FM89_9FIRM|nr:amino acid permease [Desulfosporosinus acididurans]KLU64068.1 GABA permease [Desulfosporosinus acididurans]
MTSIQDKSSKMSAFSLTMLAIGSIIGAGMFLGVGLTIRLSGPSIILAYAIMGILMYFNLSFLAELSLLDPEKGSFQTYAAKAFGPGVGFIIGWLYWISGILVMSSEATAAAIFSALWFPGIPLWAFIVIYTVILTGVNLSDPRGFGKLESGLAIVKVIALIGFIILGIVLVFFPLFGGAPGWHNISNTPFFVHGLSGFAGSLLLVFYAYSGTSVVGLAITESSDPEKTVPKVVLITSFLVTTFYVISVLFLILLHPWTTYNASTSPYVSALLPYKIPIVQSIMNFVILTATLSAMSASMYGTSRMLNALAQQGEAPHLFNKVTKKAVPRRALLFTNVFLVGIAFLSYVIPNKIYLLVTGASGLLSLVNVLTISLAHWRLRPKFLENRKDYKTHVIGYPVSNIIVTAIFIGVFFSAFAIPDQRASFFLGLSLIVITAGAYFFLRHKLGAKPQAPETIQNQHLAPTSENSLHNLQHLAQKTEKRISEGFRSKNKS